MPNTNPIESDGTLDASIENGGRVRFVYYSPSGRVVIKAAEDIIELTSMTRVSCAGGILHLEGDNISFRGNEFHSGVIRIHYDRLEEIKVDERDMTITPVNQIGEVNQDARISTSMPVPPPSRGIILAPVR